MTVFFGCRMKSLDNIYGAELEEMSREGVITEYHIAESRADPNNKVWDMTFSSNPLLKCKSTSFCENLHSTFFNNPVTLRCLMSSFDPPPPFFPHFCPLYTQDTHKTNGIKFKKCAGLDFIGMK